MKIENSKSVNQGENKALTVTVSVSHYYMVDLIFFIRLSLQVINNALIFFI